MSLTKPFIRSLPFKFQRQLQVQNESGSKYINVERAAVRSIGGTPHKILNGPDGYTKGFIQRPIEVKYASKDFRYRVGKRDHEEMLKRNGIYIFINDRGEQRKMTAQQANSLLAYNWLSDLRSNGQNYLHSFIMVSDVFR